MGNTPGLSSEVVVTTIPSSSSTFDPQGKKKKEKWTIWDKIGTASELKTDIRANICAAKTADRDFSDVKSYILRYMYTHALELCVSKKLLNSVFLGFKKFSQ